MKHKLVISKLNVKVEGKRVIEELNLCVASGEVHVIMGPNGSGKSSLAFALMGHPTYTVEKGQISLDGESLLKLSPSQRVKKGLFLTFQNPVAISGVPLSRFLISAQKSLNEKKIDVSSLYQKVQRQAQKLKMGEEFLDRSINDGLSGGERKKSEVLQMLVLCPKFVVLDEVDSGLDIDALKIIAKAIGEEVKKGLGVILVTHSSRILKFIKPDKIHILSEGKLIKSGSYSLVERIERLGYETVAS